MSKHIAKERERERRIKVKLDKAKWTRAFHIQDTRSLWLPLEQLKLVKNVINSFYVGPERREPCKSLANYIRIIWKFLHVVTRHVKIAAKVAWRRKHIWFPIVRHKSFLRGFTETWSVRNILSRQRVNASVEWRLLMLFTYKVFARSLEADKVFALDSTQSIDLLTKTKTVFDGKTSCRKSPPLRVIESTFPQSMTKTNVFVLLIIERDGKTFFVSGNETNN